MGVEVGAREVLTSTSFQLCAGESLAVMGPSGSGKTTLLSCVAGLVLATTGEVRFDGDVLSELSGSKRAKLRLERMGLIFQDPELLLELSVVENAALGLIFGGVPKATALERARDRLCEVGLESRVDDAISTLSGGEAQRVAVARAVAGDPALIVADEPTASLDQQSARAVAATLVSESRQRDAALLLATHDPEIAGLCDRVLFLRGTGTAP